jgi:hypothetical protein
VAACRSFMPAPTSWTHRPVCNLIDLAPERPDRWPGLSDDVSPLFLLRGLVVVGLVVLLLILLARLGILRVGLAGLRGLIGCSNIDIGHRIIFRFNSEIFRAGS